MPERLPDGWTKAELITLAQELREIAAEHLRRPAPGHLPRWLHGKRYTDLFVDIAPGGRVASVELSFGGNWLRITNGRVQTGSTDELAIHHGQPASKAVEPDPIPSESVLSGAHTIFSNLMDTQLSAMLLSVLSESPEAPSNR